MTKGNYVVIQKGGCAYSFLDDSYIDTSFYIGTSYIFYSKAASIFQTTHPKI